jgi:hypothetical protein
MVDGGSREEGRARREEGLLPSINRGTRRDGPMCPSATCVSVRRRKEKRRMGERGLRIENRRSRIEKAKIQDRRTMN